jgi:hypothetical protein
MPHDVSEACRRMAAAIHALAVNHGVSQVGVAVGRYYSGEAAMLKLPRDADWARLHAFLSNVADCAVQGTVVKLDTYHGELLIAVVPLTAEAAAAYAKELRGSLQTRSSR